MDYLTSFGEGLALECAHGGGGSFDVVLTKDWHDILKSDGIRNSDSVDEQKDGATDFYGYSFNWIGSSASFVAGTNYTYKLFKTNTYEKGDRRSYIQDPRRDGDFTGTINLTSDGLRALGRTSSLSQGDVLSINWPIQLRATS